MSALAGPVLVGAALLVVGGALKVTRPDDTVRALTGAGLRLHRRHVQAASAAEVVIGVVAAATGHAVALAAMALSFAAFAGFVAVALRRHLPLSSCGCLGRIDTPPTWIHVCVNSSLALVSAMAAVEGLGPLHDTLADQPLLGVPFLAWTTLATWFAVVAMSQLPRTRAALKGALR